MTQCSPEFVIDTNNSFVPKYKGAPGLADQVVGNFLNAEAQSRRERALAQNFFLLSSVLFNRGSIDEDFVSGIAAVFCIRDCLKHREVFVLQGVFLRFVGGGNRVPDLDRFYCSEKSLKTKSAKVRALGFGPL